MPYINNSTTPRCLSRKKRKIVQTIFLFLLFCRWNIDNRQKKHAFLFYRCERSTYFFTETKNHAAKGQRIPAKSHKLSVLISTPNTPDIAQRLVKMFAHSACDIPAAKTRWCKCALSARKGLYPCKILRATELKRSIMGYAKMNKGASAERCIPWLNSGRDSIPSANPNASEPQSPANTCAG